MTQPILVNGKPFFGRVEEQKRFRAAPKGRSTRRDDTSMLRKEG